MQSMVLRTAWPHDRSNLLFVADMLGIIRVDLLTNESEDVDPGAHDTLSGVDGLHWNKANFWACSMAPARIA
jgi:hypothetical protein